jgi:hypothetical protein
VPALEPVREQIYGRKTRFLDVITDGVMEVLFEPAPETPPGGQAGSLGGQAGGGYSGYGGLVRNAPLTLALGAGYSVDEVVALELALSDQARKRQAEGAASSGARWGSGPSGTATVPGASPSRLSTTTITTFGGGSGESGSGSGSGGDKERGASGGDGGSPGDRGGGLRRAAGEGQKDDLPLRLQLLLEAAQAMQSLGDIQVHGLLDFDDVGGDQCSLFKKSNISNEDTHRPQL